MSKQTIIDWQPNEILVASSHRRGHSATVEQVSQQRYGEGLECASAKAAVANAVGDLGLGKSPVTVVASRELVEVRTLSVPKMDADELPDVIRFQAQRQLANMGDNWALDFVMLPADPAQEMNTALVGAISPANLNAIEAACSEAGLQVSQVALRPIEIARFASASGQLSTSASSIIVCLSGQDADILLVKAGHVAMIRGIKLPEDADAVQAALGGELRRSLIASSGQLSDAPLANVLLIATPELASSVEQTLADACGVAVNTLDPSTLLHKKVASRSELAQASANRLAGIAGASLLELADKAVTLDFRNPKKRPPKKKNTTLYLLAGAAAALLLLAGASWFVNTSATLSADLEEYEALIEGKEPLVESSRKKIAQLGEVEEFMSKSPNYLDELTYLAQRIPDAEKVILGSPTFTTLSDGRGQIRVPLAADSSTTISEFEESLRDDDHVVKGSDPRHSDQPTEFYKWEAVETILISNRGWSLDETSQRLKGSTEPSEDEASEAEVTDEGADTESADENSDEGEDGPPAETESDDTEPKENEGKESEGKETPVPDGSKQAATDPQGNSTT